MRVLLRVLGVLMVLQGAGGVVDHLGGSHWLGPFLINRTGLFDGYELYANLVLGALGVAVVAAASSAAGKPMK
ncbi:hypothetical protein [Pseudonocardia acaciae]|uniref:hypothetical protein n=1 Tax=Pseudonocardia acaciae TaxID=551276 RepID=UPI00048B580E|nr:hypothetical protein [Pseudonocardia acaciae]